MPVPHAKANAMRTEQWPAWDANCCRDDAQFLSPRPPMGSMCHTWWGDYAQSPGVGQAEVLT